MPGLAAAESGGSGAVKQVLINAVNDSLPGVSEQKRDRDLRKTEKMIKFGSESVPVYRGDWKPAPEELYRQSYRKTYNLKPGQSWFDLPIDGEQIEAYAIDNLGRAVPVGALAAKELKTNGATDVAFVELWKVVLVDENLVGIPPAGNPLWQIINKVEKTSQGLSGFPDVLALFPDGRIIFREIKRRNKDSIRPNQHEAADRLRKMFGSRADLAIVEWA